MFNWKGAFVLLGMFVVVGLIYWFVQTPTTVDRTGVTLLIILGVAMGFGFLVLLRGSREL
jgi:lipoprotein signal peptidase